MIDDFVKTRLDQMLTYPENWGGPEAYELQVLLLIEIEMLMANRLAEADSLRLVLDRYSMFLQKELPSLGARPLSTVIDDFEKLSEHLTRFRQSLDGVSHHDGTSLFEYVGPDAPEGLGSDVAVEPAQTTMPRAKAA